MAEEKEEAEEVRVSRTEIMTPTRDGPPVLMVHTTYFVRGLVPGLVSLPKEEWSEEREAELIREDIKKRRKEKPTVIRL